MSHIFLCAAGSLANIKVCILYVKSLTVIAESVRIDTSLVLSLLQLSSDGNHVSLSMVLSGPDQPLQA